MQMQIFKAERQIRDKILNNTSVAYYSPIIKFGDKPEEIGHAIASRANPDQPDLFYLDSVLVSTNWNGNDDVTSRDEAWAARHTPEDKQFNFMHNEKHIIGHITGSSTVFSNGIIVPDGEIPVEDFDIVISSVLYRRWEDTALKARMEKLIAEIKEGKWFVSMECSYRGFDYSAKASSGEAFVIARTEETAFLSQHLRVYGGKGEYEGYRIGRQLKNIVYKGVGLVDHPANPRSVILGFNKANKIREAVYKGDEVNKIIVAFQLKEKQMDEQALQNLRAEFEQVKAELAKSADTLKADLVTKDALITELKSSVAGFQKAKEDLEAKLTVANADLEKVRKESLVVARKSQLVGLGLTTEEADATLVKFVDVSDAVFASVVEIKSEAIKAKANPFVKKEDDCDKDKEEDEKAEKASKALDNAEGESAAALNVDDTAGETVAFAAAQSYFENLFGVKKENK